MKHLLVSCLLSASIGQCALIYDNGFLHNFYVSNRPAGESSLANVTVSSSVVINQIGAMVDLGTAGNLKFLIFDNATSTLLFASAPEAFADDGKTFKVSTIFAPFTLEPGITYAIGAIADVPGIWPYSMIFGSQIENNVTVSYLTNANVSNFAAPVLVAPGQATLMLQLYSPDVNVPEPSSAALFGVLTAVLLGTPQRLQRLVRRLHL